MLVFLNFNNSSVNIKSSTTQVSRVVQYVRFLRKFSGPLMKNGLLLMKNVFTPLAKSLLIPIKLTAAASAGDAVIYKKYHWIKNHNIDDFKWRNELYKEND